MLPKLFHWLWSFTAWNTEALETLRTPVFDSIQRQAHAVTIEPDLPYGTLAQCQGPRAWDIKLNSKMKGFKRDQDLRKLKGISDVILSKGFQIFAFFFEMALQTCKLLFIWRWNACLFPKKIAKIAQRSVCETRINFYFCILGSKFLSKILYSCRVG